jgi:hypothetical protein
MKKSGSTISKQKTQTNVNNQSLLVPAPAQDDNVSTKTAGSLKSQQSIKKPVVRAATIKGTKQPLFDIDEESMGDVSVNGDSVKPEILDLNLEDLIMQQ